VIDSFKALCAIYMGASLLQVHISRMHTDLYFLIFKMLQTSVLMMYFGNICSVFNLILATSTSPIHQLKHLMQYCTGRAGLSNAGPDTGRGTTYHFSALSFWRAGPINR
jgi:hypothetical protein